MRVAMSSNYRQAELLIKPFQDSFWMNISATNRSDVLILTEVTKM